MDQSEVTGEGSALRAAVAVLRAGTEAALQEPAAGAFNAEVPGLLLELAAVQAQVAAVSLRVVAEARQRGLPAEAGATSLAVWLRHLLRLSPREAGTLARLAGALDLGPRPGPGSVVAGVGDADQDTDTPDSAGSDADVDADMVTLSVGAALREGRVSLEHAGVMARTLAMVDALPGVLSARARAEAEAFPIGQALQLGPDRVATLGRYLVDTLDQAVGADLEARERAQHAGRAFTAVLDYAGMLQLRGSLPPEAGALLLAVLDPLAAPQPADDGTRDPRTATQRRADALIQLVKLAAESGGVPVHGGNRACVLVTMTLDALQAGIDQHHADMAAGGASHDERAPDSDLEGSPSGGQRAPHPDLGGRPRGGQRGPHVDLHESRSGAQRAPHPDFDESPGGGQSAAEQDIDNGADPEARPATDAVTKASPSSHVDRCSDEGVGVGAVRHGEDRAGADIGWVDGVHPRESQAGVDGDAERGDPPGVDGHADHGDPPRVDGLADLGDSSGVCDFTDVGDRVGVSGRRGGGDRSGVGDRPGGLRDLGGVGGVGCLGGQAATLLPSGQPLSAAAARRLACDADLIPVVLGSAGQVLDIGRATRQWTWAQHKAIALRDQGCIFPGCDRPPGWTQIHHIRYWSQHGGTDIDNAAMLCDTHHDCVHHHGWTIIMGTDGHPHMHPPAWMPPSAAPPRDPHQRWRRQLARIAYRHHKDRDTDKPDDGTG